jgi:hypothetical protein
VIPEISRAPSNVWLNPLLIFFMLLLNYEKTFAKNLAKF